MPYIRSDRRDAVRPVMRPVLAETAGELNFQITSLLLAFLATHGRTYPTLNAISGACTEALAEFRRRVIVPYEDERRALYGDVYP
jgi:hypothetical protein